jgi:small subunit ribosomal protein S4e
MGKHLKRLASPRSWKIKRKAGKWVVKPGPGPHRKDESIPLLLLVRDYLHLGNTSNEAKKIINQGKILVDKVVRKDYKFPVGLMDVIEIPEIKQRRIVLLDEKGRLTLKKLLKKNSKYKLCKIVNKTVVKGGHIQLNLHDGRNILIKVSDPTNPVEDIYRTNDTVVINLDKNTISNHLHYREGSIALITGGSHRSKVAKIEEIKKTRSPEPNIVKLKVDDTSFETIEDYVFVIGEEEPFIAEVAK